MNRWVIKLSLTAAIGLALSAPAFGADKTLQEQVTEAQNMDLRATPPAESRAQLDALLQKSREKNSGISQADIFLLRKTIASTYFFERNMDRSLELMDELAADVTKSPVKDTDVDMEIRGNRAALMHQMGRTKEALELMLGVRSWFAEHNGKDSEMYISTTGELIAFYYSLGDPITAEKYAAETVAIARASATVKPEDLVRYWANWATVLHGAGRTADALREMQAANHFAEEKFGPEHPLSYNTLRNLGVQLNNAGRHAEALPILLRTAEIGRKLEGDKSITLAYTLNSIGQATYMTRGPAAALPFYEQAVAAYKASPDTATPHFFGELRLNVAQTHEAMGHSDEALKQRREIVTQVKAAVGDKHATYARALGDLGASLVNRRQPKQALPYLQEASSLYATLQKPNSNLRIQNSVTQGIAMVQTGDAAGYQLAKDAANTAREAILTDLTTPAQTLRNASQYAAALTDFAELAMSTNHDADAFEAIQLAQLGDLDSAGAALMARTAGSDTGIGTQLRQLQDRNADLAKLRTQRSALMAQGKTADAGNLDRQASELEQTIAALSTSIHQAFPEYARLIRPEPERLDRLQARLAPGSKVLLVQPGRTTNLAMLVSSSAVEKATSTSKRGELGDLVKSFRGSIDSALEADDFSTPFDVGTAYKLYASVVPSAMTKSVSRSDVLYVQAGGYLASIPFAALVTQKPKAAKLSGNALRGVPWLAKTASVLTPATLTMVGNEHKLDSSVQFAGIGAPVLQGKGSYALALRGLMRSGAGNVSDVAALPPLPGARQELENMAVTFGKRDSLLLTGNDATRERILATDLSKYNVLAFATHGLVSGELRGLTEPGLVVTPEQSKPGSGVLTASDVAMLKLDADWVILSACNTAAGDGTGAPMYSGLARAFVYAGARGLLLSQWPVRDDIASRLTQQTVSAAQQGSSRAAALRKSQLKLIADKSVKGSGHPAAWAPFVLIGP